jgi:hypothetical protein
MKVGNGITERTKPDMVPATPENMLAFLRGINRKIHEPWGGYADIIAFARRRLAQIKAEAPSNYADLEGHNAHFVERVSEGWYVQSIDLEARVAERAIADGRPWEACACSMRIGELLTELRMKQLWEPDALRGRKIAQSAALTRKGEQAARVAEVDRLVAAGELKTAAFAIVAEAQRVTAKAIETDYYKAKKNRS